MPTLNVSASIDIATPIQQVHRALVDFNTWPAWSPWLYMEPDATVSYRGSPGELNHGYDWNGKKVGSGGMTLTKTSDVRIECDLQFLKPFKSEADVAFDLQSLADTNTRVSWHMKSSLPFFLFWMKATMSGMIQSDYDRGLNLLKDYLELKKITSTSQLTEISDVDPIHYVGSRGSTNMKDIAQAMGASFSAVVKLIDSESIQVNGVPLTIYNKMDIKRGVCHYTAALPTADPVSAKQPFVAATIPACRALKVVHTGPYRHLGNAWYVLMGEARFKKLKIRKSVPPFEIYLNDPDTTQEEELITELYLPVQT